LYKSSFSPSMILESIDENKSINNVDNGHFSKPVKLDSAR